MNTAKNFFARTIVVVEEKLSLLAVGTVLMIGQQVGADYRELAGRPER